MPTVITFHSHNNTLTHLEGMIDGYGISCDDMLADEISIKIADYGESCDAAGTEFLSSEFSAAGAGCYCPSTMDLLMIMFEGGTAEEVKRAISAFASCTTCDEIIDYAEAVMVFQFAINQFGDLEMLDCNAAGLYVCSLARMGNCAEAHVNLNTYIELGCDRDLLYDAYQPCAR